MQAVSHFELVTSSTSTPALNSMQASDILCEMADLLPIAEKKDSLLLAHSAFNTASVVHTTNDNESLSLSLLIKFNLFGGGSLFLLFVFVTLSPWSAHRMEKLVNQSRTLVHHPHSHSHSQSQRRINICSDHLFIFSLSLPLSALCSAS